MQSEEDGLLRTNDNVGLLQLYLEDKLGPGYEISIGTSFKKYYAMIRANDKTYGIFVESADDPDLDFKLKEVKRYLDGEVGSL